MLGKYLKVDKFIHIRTYIEFSFVKNVALVFIFRYTPIQPLQIFVDEWMKTSKFEWLKKCNPIKTV